MINQLNIKIFCRSFDLRLYRLSKGLYESWGFPCVRLTDQSADGYFLTMMKDKDCDIAINVDEDCFITSKEAIMRLVDYVISNGIANAGCSDEGAGVPRRGLKQVTNPFFNVFDLRQIRQAYSKEAVKHYSEGIQVRGYLEPYYPFFLWMADNLKVEYLQNERHCDGTTTILYNNLGEEMCRHTWFARFYSVPAFIVKHWQPTIGAQQKRIDNVINEAYAAQQIAKPKFSFSDELCFIGNKIIRWIIKIPQRVCGWPKKIKRRLSRA